MPVAPKLAPAQPALAFALSPFGAVTIRPKRRVLQQRWSLLADLASDGVVPPYPTSWRTPPVFVPPAPTLPQGLSRADLAAKLRAAYLGLARAKGIRPLHTRPTQALRAKLAQAGDYMEQNELPPSAWAGWSFEQYNHGARERAQLRGKKWKPLMPPIEYVFDLKRLHDRSGWFRDECDRWTTGTRQVLTPLRTKLLKDYAAMVSELRSDPHLEANKASVVISRYFPMGYERTLKEANDEAKQRKQELRAAAQQGEYLW